MVVLWQLTVKGIVEENFFLFLLEQALAERRQGQVKSIYLLFTAPHVFAVS